MPNDELTALESDVKRVGRMPTGGHSRNQKAASEEIRKLKSKYPQYDINRMLRVLGHTGDYRARLLTPPTSKER